MKLSDAWITQSGEHVVVGLCKECHRTYGHDDDCRAGALVQLEAENEELETNLSLAISMYEGEDSPMAKLEQEKHKLKAENEALRDASGHLLDVIDALLTGEDDEQRT